MEPKDNQQTRVVFSTFKDITEFGYIPNERAFDLYKMFANCSTYCSCGPVCLTLRKSKDPGDDTTSFAIDHFHPRGKPLCAKDCKENENANINCGEKIKQRLCPDPFMRAFYEIIEKEK